VTGILTMHEVATVPANSDVTAPCDVFLLASSDLVMTLRMSGLDVRRRLPSGHASCMSCVAHDVNRHMGGEQALAVVTTMERGPMDAGP
jgi:hypothetical protein